MKRYTNTCLDIVFKTSKISLKFAGIVTGMCEELPGQTGGNNLLTASDLTISSCPLEQIKMCSCIKCACVCVCVCVGI